ncbi:MAG TPA: CYTH domain-containing protein [Caldithrix abyssi]|uniref:CYTH domain-containing protein n=1 Tax=Caldithrix abyssi TaxID=187145 RepID=A0A7V5PR36_CALAY|nr:CYTH domain-containing protein [Caldithrix abyssi]
MGKEIERKYLVKGDSWKELARGVMYRQGYLSTVKERVVRVRTIDDKGYLTIKGISKGISRLEFEYEIPLEDANKMLDELCERPLIEKARYKIEYGGLVWEVDEFFGDNEGLILAEVELSDENQHIELPDWIGEEVSGDPRYFNSNLIKHPYKEWNR